MPELPEVETYKEQLNKSVKGKRVMEVKLLWKGVVRHPGPRAFVRKVKGKNLSEAERRGKFLIIPLKPEEDTLIIHFGMTGVLHYLEPEGGCSPHTRAIFALDDGKELRYIDVRKLGGFYLVQGRDFSKIPELDKMGVEPLSEEFSLEAFKGMLERRRQKLKPFLMRQDTIAGIGNIYANEILWEAKLHPLKSTADLTEEEVRRLYEAIRKILAEGVELKGCSIEEFLDLYGQPGRYEERLRAYQREGQPCLRCGEEIVRIVVGGRGTFYCPKCQSHQGWD